MASHDAGLDVLVGDLLVVVGAAAGRVHGRGCHGVEREDELLSVTHAGRLRVIPRDACGGEATGKGALKGGLQKPGLQVEKHRYRGSRPRGRSAWLHAGPMPPQVPVRDFRSQLGRRPEGRVPRHGQGSLQPWVPAAPASPSTDTEPGLGGFWWLTGKWSEGPAGKIQRPPLPGQPEAWAWRRAATFQPPETAVSLKQ